MCWYFSFLYIVALIRLNCNLLNVNKLVCMSQEHKVEYTGKHLSSLLMVMSHITKNSRTELLAIVAD